MEYQDSSVSWTWNSRVPIVLEEHYFWRLWETLQSPKSLDNFQKVMSWRNIMTAVIYSLTKPWVLSHLSLCLIPPSHPPRKTVHEKGTGRRRGLKMQIWVDSFHPEQVFVKSLLCSENCADNPIRSTGRSSTLNSPKCQGPSFMNLAPSTSE